MANQPFDPERMSHFDEPGSDELWDYMQSGEYEDFTAEWYQDAGKMGQILDDEREAGDGYSEIGFRSFSLQDLINAGGLSYCRILAKMQDVNQPMPISSAFNTISDMKVHCKDLNKKMNWRKRACTTFLMFVTYNPRYPNLIGPITQKQVKKARYCKKITKLRNPWRYCTASCPAVQGINVPRCMYRRSQCNKYLDEFWKNTNPTTGRWQDRAGIPCKELPKQFKSTPPGNHPVNDHLRCGPVVCDWIPTSEQPWCSA